MSNATAYYLEAIGYTSGNNELKTNKISFIIEYQEQSGYSVLSLTNNCVEGYITYYSNAIKIDGESSPSPPVYTNNGVDLTQSNSWVKWDEELKIPDNFTLKALLYKPNLDSTLIILAEENENNNIKINYMIYPLDETKVICTIEINEGYFIYSNPIDIPDNEDLLCIQIRRINNLFDIVLEEVI